MDITGYSDTHTLFSNDNGITWGSQFVGKFYDDNPPPFNGLNAVTSFDSSLAWIVGTRGMILRYNKTQTSKSLTLTSPNGGKIYRKGETMNITWISKGIDQVKLRLQRSYPPNIAENIRHVRDHIYGKFHQTQVEVKLLSILRTLIRSAISVIIILQYCLLALHGPLKIAPVRVH